MTIVLGLDFESTGLDANKDRITEIGACFYNLEAKTPLHMTSSLLYMSDYPDVHPEAGAKTGITTELLKAYGQDPAPIFKHLTDICATFGVEYLVGHNAKSFDSKFLKAAIDRGECPEFLGNIPWLDTRFDLPYPPGYDTRKLDYLAYEHGFMNPFPHRALFDVMTMLKVASFYECDEIVKFASEPSVVISAQVSYENKDLAKDSKFSWERIGDDVYKKQWVKQVKASKLPEEMTKYPFRVVVCPKIS